MSDIWANKVSHDRFCQEILIAIDFKDNYHILESWMEAVSVLRLDGKFL